MPKHYLIPKQFLIIFQNKQIVAKFVQVSLSKYKKSQIETEI